ncbi:Na(+)/H(+) antiporter subunit C [Streptomyces sp. TP-A0874]|uniref:Na(+)/H(+) antiporter subunit C n=1 Tax=Streptomyces sp. TP-A0874 TaxID=549819 RepID=UPI000852B7D6|nr:Na(+)/H(+) antiporter subunit C [Streptomyces sp. TP-A0874]
MTVTLSLLFVGGVLFSAGAVLMLTRALTRILVGAVIMGNGVNVLILSTAGRAGQPALAHPGADLSRITDPLPQVMVLTAIVITLALTAFMLAMAYRSWQLTGSDEVRDDIEDRRVALRGEEAAERARLQDEYWKRRRQQLSAVPERGAVADRRRLTRVRAEYLRSRFRLRRRLRAARARQARAANLSGDLWDNVLGEDR